MESHKEACFPNQKELPTKGFEVQAETKAGSIALGIRFKKNVKKPENRLLRN